MSGSAKVIGAIDVGELFGEKLSHEMPKGFHTAEEIAKVMGCTATTIRAKLKPLREAGEIEYRRVCINSGYMFVYLVNL